jgi:hypothetical protein
MFARKDAFLPVPDWHVDAMIEDIVRKSLAPGLAVKPATVDRTALFNARLSTAENALERTFPGLVPSADFDSYLVIFRYPREILDAVQGEGLGVGNYRPGRGEIKTAVYANFAIALIDAKTLKILWANLAVTSPKYASLLPAQEVDNSLWPASPPNVTSEQLTRLREMAAELLRDTVPETLFRMGLTGMMASEEPPPVAQPSAN